MEMQTEFDSDYIMDNKEIKDTFLFHEVATITDVKPYVLRFWESEFEEISPIILESGQKIYSQKDIDQIKEIKELLFNKKMSIPEAKSTLRQQIQNSFHKTDISLSENFSVVGGVEFNSPPSTLLISDTNRIDFSAEINNVKSKLELISIKLENLKLKLK
jgi:DNA-binding transcriptional MerR regulator